MKINSKYWKINCIIKAEKLDVDQKTWIFENFFFIAFAGFNLYL